MKRQFKLLAAAVFLLAALTGCAPKPAPEPTQSPSESPSASPSPSPEESASPSAGQGSAKLGLAAITSLAKSTDAGADDGTAQIDTTVVAVAVDGDRIVDCVIDAVGAKINFDSAGQLVTPGDTVFKTKKELGDAYNMRETSDIGREWNEQADAFAEYVRGMTVEEVKGIKVDETNHPTGADLKASVTISVGDFIKGVEKAVAEAKGEGGAPDRLRLGIVAGVGRSAGASQDGQGLAQLSATFAALATDAGGRITGCVLDGLQANVNFGADGKITTDLSVAPQTKNELGEGYGLKSDSAIGKEWNEQAEAFAEYVTGKTPAEVEGIAVGEKGDPVSEDLKSSVTIDVGAFKQVIKKALPPA